MCGAGHAATNSNQIFTAWTLPDLLQVPQSFGNILLYRCVDDGRYYPSPHLDYSFRWNLLAFSPSSAHALLSEALPFGAGGILVPHSVHRASGLGKAALDTEMAHVLGGRTLSECQFYKWRLYCVVTRDAHAACHLRYLQKPPCFMEQLSNSRLLLCV